MRYVIKHTAPAGDWHTDRAAGDLPNLFPRGSGVRHLNPRHADWRGTVQPSPGTGRHLCTVDPGYLAVYVVWHAGAPVPGSTVPPAAGWYSASVVAPDPDADPSAAMPPALPTTEL